MFWQNFISSLSIYQECLVGFTCAWNTIRDMKQHTRAIGTFFTILHIMLTSETKYFGNSVVCHRVHTINTLIIAQLRGRNEQIHNYCLNNTYRWSLPLLLKKLLVSVAVVSVTKDEGSKLLVAFLVLFLFMYLQVIMNNNYCLLLQSNELKFVITYKYTKLYPHDICRHGTVHTNL